MTRVRILAILLPIVSALPAHAQGVIADRTSLPLFAQIPETYLQAAANTSMMFVDRSVGSFISSGLTCLTFASDTEAPNHCSRWFSSPPQSWSRAGGYPRTNWTYYGWPGTDIPPELPCTSNGSGYWHHMLECFINYVDANPGAYRVMSFQFSYLEVQSFSDIASPTTGFFVPQASRADVTDFEALVARYPQITFVLHTANLARSIGTQASTDFNAQLRAYTAQRGLPLYDVADMESHDLDGTPCYDNRDGVPYVLPDGRQENYPDDGLALPAICQTYSGEIDGGHPNASGKIRLAKMYWVLMARLAGWNPVSNAPPPSAPTNVRLVPN